MLRVTQWKPDTPYGTHNACTWDISFRSTTHKYNIFTFPTKSYFASEFLKRCHEYQSTCWDMFQNDKQHTATRYLYDDSVIY